MKNLHISENPGTKGSRRRGFSLLELLIALAAISCVVAMGIVLFSDTNSSVKEAKLHQDVATLNRAVSTYRISGGDLNAVSTGIAVLHKLKTTAAQRTRIAGLRGAMIDPRLSGVASSGNGALRAVWDNTAKRFVVRKTGSGFREFVIEGALDSLPAPLVEDRAVLMAMNSQDKWIWSFNDPSRAGSPPRQAAAVTPTEVVTPSGGSNMTVLSAPQFSIPGGLYDFDAFNPDLKVSLVDPNPQHTAQLYYSLANGPWKQWTGTPISVARALTTELRAYSVPLNADRFEESAVASNVYETIFFSGSSTAGFQFAWGPPGLVCNLLAGRKEPVFVFGNPANGPTPKSITFAGENFVNVAPEQLFKFGTLTYTHFQTLTESNPTGVELSVTVKLTSPWLEETLPFPLTLVSHPFLPSLASETDVVTIRKASTKFNTIIKGRTFYLVLNFAPASDKNGWTTLSEINIYKNKTMTGSIFGRFTTTPPLP